MSSFVGGPSWFSPQKSILDSKPLLAFAVVIPGLLSNRGVGLDSCGALPAQDILSFSETVYSPLRAGLVE